MWFLYDSVGAISVAAVCAAFAWLFGGTIPSALTPTIPWLFAIMLEMALCFPQRHAGESTYEARARVWRKMKRDPLTWVVLGFIVMLLVPFVNKGMCPSCDYPAVKFDGVPESPPVPFIPFCVNRAEHLAVVMWFVPALMAMLAVRHSLLRRGKRIVIELIVWNGFALAIVGMVQSVMGAQGPLWCDFGQAKAYFFSTFGYPNMAGDYFTTLFGLSLALWRRKVDVANRESSGRGGDPSSKANHKVFWNRHLMLVPAAVFFFSVMVTLSRGSIMLVVAMAMLGYMHALTCFLARQDKAKRVKTAAVNLVSLVLIATLFFVFMSDKVRAQIAQAKTRDLVDGAAEQAPQRLYADDLEREMKSVDIYGILDRMSGQGQYHARVATAVWKSFPLFGCGGWGYKHFSVVKMTDEEYAKIQSVGGANVHNDYLQFLAEHGAVGLALLVVMVVMLLWPIGRVWRAIVNSVRFLKPKEQPPRPIALFALPAPVFCILMTTVATLLHALADCPLRSPAVLSLFFVSLASIEGFLPKIKEKH